MYERSFKSTKDVLPSDKSLIKRLFTYFSLTAFKIEYYITGGKGSTTGYKQRLWFGYKKVVPLLWYEIGNIWHWQSKKFSNSIPGICSTIHPTASAFISNVKQVPIPIVDKNKQAQSYIYLKIKKPYIALNSETYIFIENTNSETYISLITQELDTWKKIGYEFYCEELFVVKHKTKYNCESVIDFDWDNEIIKEKLWIPILFQ